MKRNKGLKWNKSILIMMLLILLLPQVMAVQIQYSEDNSTWRNVTNVDEFYKEAVQENIPSSQIAYFRGRRNENKTWEYVSQRTKAEGFEILANIAIMGFVLSLVIGLFILPFKVNFSENWILNDLVKRGCWVLGLLFLSLGAAMLATMAETAGIALLSEIFTFMWLINWAVYFSMLFLVISFLFSTIKTIRQNKMDERMGGL